MLLGSLAMHDQKLGIHWEKDKPLLTWTNQDGRAASVPLKSHSATYFGFNDSKVTLGPNEEKRISFRTHL